MRRLVFTNDVLSISWQKICFCEFKVLIKTKKYFSFLMIFKTLFFKKPLFFLNFSNTFVAIKDQFSWISHYKNNSYFHFSHPYIPTQIPHISIMIPCILPIPTPIPCIPTLIPDIPTMIPHIPTQILCIPIIPCIPHIPTMILYIPTLIPRLLMIPLISFPDSLFRHLQVARLKMHYFLKSCKIRFSLLHLLLVKILHLLLLEKKLLYFPEDCFWHWYTKDYIILTEHFSTYFF